MDTLVGDTMVSVARIPGLRTTTKTTYYDHYAVQVTISYTTVLIQTSEKKLCYQRVNLIVAQF